MCSTTKAVRALNGENFEWTTIAMQKLWLIWYSFGLVLGVSFYMTSELEMLKYLLLERYWAHGFLSVNPFDVRINVNVISIICNIILWHLFLLLIALIWRKKWLKGDQSGYTKMDFSGNIHFIFCMDGVDGREIQWEYNIVQWIWRQI